MPTYLRPHHLLCILTYKGLGYTNAFVENFDQIIINLSKDPKITIIKGCDDICKAWLDEPACHCHNHSIIVRDQLALQCLSAALGYSIDIGSTLALDKSLRQKLRYAFARTKTLRTACENCQWYDLCGDIASNNFQDAML